MFTRTTIAYIPIWWKKNNSHQKNHQKKIKYWSSLWRYGKYIVLVVLIAIYLIYTNQSSTLWYALRQGLRDIEHVQEQLDAVQQEVSKKEQQLRSQVNRVTYKNTTTIVVP